MTGFQDDPNNGSNISIYWLVADGVGVLCSLAALLSQVRLVNLWLAGSAGWADWQRWLGGDY